MDSLTTRELFDELLTALLLQLWLLLTRIRIKNERIYSVELSRKVLPLKPVLVLVLLAPNPKPICGGEVAPRPNDGADDVAGVPKSPPAFCDSWAWPKVDEVPKVFVAVAPKEEENLVGDGEPRVIVVAELEHRCGDVYVLQLRQKHVQSLWT